MVHSVHCMMGFDSLQSAGGELSVEEQVQRLFSVRSYYSSDSYFEKIISYFYYFLVHDPFMTVKQN